MQNKFSIDHLGNKFASQHDMCEYWGISESLYLYRLNHGYTMQEALTKKSGRSTVIDHDGNEFVNIEEMCVHYGVSRDTYNHRVTHGWTKKEALTTPVERDRVSIHHQCIGPNGVVYASMSAMCVAYGISRSLVSYRMRQGKSLAEALIK